MSNFVIDGNARNEAGKLAQLLAIVLVITRTARRANAWLAQSLPHSLDDGTSLLRTVGVALNGLRVTRHANLGDRAPVFHRQGHLARLHEVVAPVVGRNLMRG